MSATAVYVPSTLPLTSHKLDLLLVSDGFPLPEHRKVKLVHELQTRVNSFRLHLIAEKGSLSGPSFLAKETWVKSMGKGIIHTVSLFNGEPAGFEKKPLLSTTHEEIAKELVLSMNLIVLVPESFDKNSASLIHYVNEAEKHDVNYFPV